MVAEIDNLMSLFTPQNNSEFARVLVMTQQMSMILERLLKVKMRKLNSELKSKLFTGNGPLASFSSKIDLCYALEIIDKPIHTKLHHIRGVRNVFAHSDVLISFDHESFKTNSKLDANPLRYGEAEFSTAFWQCIEALIPMLQNAALLEAMATSKRK